MTQDSLTRSEPVASEMKPDHSLLNENDPQVTVPDSPQSESAKANEASSLKEPTTSDPPKMLRDRRSSFGAFLMYNVVIPLALLSIGGVVIALLGKVEPAIRPASDTSVVGRMKALPAVRVQPVRSLDSVREPLQLKVDGTVVPYREVQVATEVAGRIVFKSPACEAGSFVSQDELLLRIDPTDYEVEVERLTRLQEQEYQALRELDQEEVNVNRVIELAKQDVELQRRELARRKSLPSGFASQAEIDQANRAVLAADQQLTLSLNQLDLLKKRRARLEASERLAKTQLRGAEINLQRTEIRSPIDGVIVNDDAELNTFVSRGSVVVTLEDVTKVEVATSLRMDQLHWVLDQRDVGKPNETRGYDLPETPAIIEYVVSGREGMVYRWNARLLSYDGIGLDPQTRTVPVRILVDDPQHYVDVNGQVQETAGPTALVRGMFVRVKLLIQPKTKLVVIPALALKPGNRVWQFVPDESVLESPEVTASIEGEVVAKPVRQNAGVPLADDSFDVSDWQAGRVVVRSHILPVDSLFIEDNSVASGTTSSPSTPRRNWVCEVRDGEIDSESWVVVSPLGSVELDMQIPARAQLEDESPPSEEADLASASSVAPSDLVAPSASVEAQQ